MSKDIRPEDLERRQDGRNIDPSLGVLSGEGSQQRVKELEHADPARGLLRTRPTQSGVCAEHPSYYGQPALKEPVWIWTIPLYFYVGGTAGAASLLGAVAELAGGPGMKRLGHRCRWMGAAGDMVSTGLLVYDLGRPERFLNMLRVFRPTSPMSLGSWILSGSGGLNSLAALLSGQRGWLGRVGDGAAIGGGMLGMPLAGYTAVLITNTATPLWQSVHKSLPLFFMSSGMAGAGCLLELLPHAPEERRVIHLFSVMGKVAQLVTGARVLRDASRVEAVGRTLKRGAPGAMWAASTACTAASLALSLWPKPRTWMRPVGALLGTAGALLARFSIFHAGKASSRDPQATFQPQRQGLGAAEVTHHARASDGKPFSFPLPVVS